MFSRVKVIFVHLILEYANKTQGRARKLPHWLRLSSGALKKSKMSTTLSGEIQKANASEPNVFTQTASLPCVFWHNLLFLVYWRSSDRTEWGYMEPVENNMKRRGFLGCDLCACMERWAGHQKSLFQLDRRRWLTHTGTFCESHHPHQPTRVSTV